MRSALRYLRHGPLKRYHFIWTYLGRVYRHFVHALPIFTSAKQKIGPYGPFRFHPRFAFSAFHQWGKQHNAGFKACVEHCRNQHCILDIGAHIGLVSLPISQVIASKGTVYAFEPAHENRRYLKYHLKRNHINNVTVIPLLVGNINKEKVLFYELASDTGMNSVVPMQHQGDFRQSTKQQITLDYFCQKYQLCPNVIKIDVEGYELAVLQGARQTLLCHQPTLYLSIHPSHLKALGHTISELIDLIHSLNYRITELDGTAIQSFSLSEISSTT